MSAPETGRRRLGVYSLGFYRGRYLRRFLKALGWEVVLGPLGQADAIGVWGARPVAARGIKAAQRRGLDLIHIEDAFLRSISPGRSEPPVGLIIDHLGNYFDASKPNDLENLLNAPPINSDEAIEMLAAFNASKLSKYNNAFRDATDLPNKGYVLVVDQVRDDASITSGLADAERFAQMLDAARRENPDTPIYIKRHPATLGAPERGHFTTADLGPIVEFLPDGLSAADVIDHASQIYCVTSQLGFEAILRGKRPRVFGAPFYAGWGLSNDHLELPRRVQTHSKQSLFKTAMLDYPHWLDVYNAKPTDFAGATRGLVARRRSAEIAHTPSVVIGARLWKRSSIRTFLGDARFCDDPKKAVALAKNISGKVVVWASKEPPELTTLCKGAGVRLLRLEDGFLRSIGLGAELTAPMSLSIDDQGIYYDPRTPSRLETLIAASTNLYQASRTRAAKLRQQLIKNRLSKYNTGAQPIKRSDRPTILVVGQVEDDASMIAAAGPVCTNREILKTARTERPDAHIIYKPHPDVEAGLRKGQIEDAAQLADEIATDTSPADAIDAADEVWTMTSLLGFEALLRAKPVTCFGHPFYAGWGLTEDRTGPIPRRTAKPDLDGLVHAVLIDYPLYVDPISKLPCPVETIVERLATGQTGPHRHRMLSKLQGMFASYAWIWR